MASQRRPLTWKAVAKALGRSLRDIFSVCNNVDVLPKTTTEEELCNGSAYSRSDLLLCVRALKVIEQLVLSGTNGIAGPLTIIVSVSGICQVLLSFVSVLNAMDTFILYNVTERYRKRLMAERTRQSPWDFSMVVDVCIPVMQFDNSDIKPLHAVKFVGKAVPKVNGSLLQGQEKAAFGRRLPFARRPKVCIIYPHKFGLRIS